MNSRETAGAGWPSSLGSSTIPFRTSFRFTFFRAKDTDCPADAAGTRIRLRSMERIRSNENIVTLVNNARFNNARNHGASERDREDVINMELEGSLGIVAAVVREDVQERPYQVQILSCDIGHLENRTYPLADKLSRCVDTLLTVFDERGNFSCSRTFHDFRDLRYRLLKNMGRTNVDFGDDHHYGNIERQRNAQVLFTHTNEAVVGCNHK